MADRILTTHVGSLPRPQEVCDSSGIALQDLFVAKALLDKAANDGVGTQLA
jgi:ornithine cyclodeaminase/alanine dehydrogenase-like protein (mu-crystallin family)